MYFVSVAGGHVNRQVPLPPTHTQGREHTHTHQIFLEAAPNGVYKWYEEQFGFERVGAIPMVRL